MSDVGGEDKRLIFGESNLCKNHLMAGVCLGQSAAGLVTVDTRGLIKLA